MFPVRLGTCIVFLIILCASCRPGGENLQSSTADTLAHPLAIPAKDTLPSTFNPEDEFLGIGVPQFGDLDSMIARRKIRCLVAYTHLYYYIDGKRRGGLAFDALNLFEESLNKQLGFYPPRVRVLFIPVSRTQVIPLLNKGYGDLAYAGITITDERKQMVDFSMPTITGLKEIIVGGPSATKLKTLADLSGKEIYLHAGSSYESSALKLSDSLVRAGLPPIIIKHADPFLETEDMLELVSTGIIPFTATVADAARLWSNVLDSLTLYEKIPLANNVSYGWVFRKDSPKLKTAADKFIKQNARGTLMGNILYNKYVTNVKLLKSMHSKKTVEDMRSLRGTFQKYADKYKFDWLLLAAQGYQESTLRQDLVSPAGAVGIMQVLPYYAARHPLYMSDVKTVDNNVHAGVKFMRFLVDQYFHGPEIDSLNGHLFALAAYNCGPGRVAQLRSIAKQKGLNPNVWFDNVEIIAAQKIGRETVQYVSNIYKFYASYRALNYYKTQREKRVVVAK